MSKIKGQGVLSVYQRLILFKQIEPIDVSKKEKILYARVIAYARRMERKEVKLINQLKSIEKHDVYDFKNFLSGSDQEVVENH